MICLSCQSANDEAAEFCFRCGKGLYALTGASLLSARYEILSPLGKGGMGMVYKALDRELDETVAIKVLRPEIAGSPEIARRFRSEIKLARKVSHKNVCRIHEYGRDGHFVYIVMEYVEGVDLKRIIRTKGPFPPDEACELAIRISGALHAIHEGGIVHRDLKTPNIMRDPNGVVKLMDFGIAKSFESGSTTMGTAAGMIVGTPEYMSPEQARGEKVDIRTDLYALGVVIYELFTGDVPFRGETPVATLLQHLQTPPPLGTPAAARVPPAVVPVLARALAKSREERFASAIEMAESLREARAGAWPLAATRHPPAQFSAAAPALDPVPDTTPMPTPVPTSVPTVPTPTPAPVPVETSDRQETPPTAVPAVVPLRPTVPTTPPRPIVRPAPVPQVRGTPWLALAGGTGAVAALAVAAWLLIGREEPPIAAQASPTQPPVTAVRAEPPPRQTSPMPPAERPSSPQADLTLPPATTLPAVAPVRKETPPPPPLRDASRPRATPPAPSTNSTLVLRPIQAPVTTLGTPPPVVTTPPSSEASPATTAPVEVPRENPPAERPAVTDGVLQIGVRPYAEVTVDGKEVGTTPRVLKLPAGPHVVKLTHPSYRPFTRKVTVRPGETTKLNVDLALDAIRK
jgi:serine/threonine protein kinase